MIKMKEPNELELDIAAEDALLERQNETLKIIAEIYQIREHNHKCFVPVIICGVVFVIFFVLFFMEDDFHLAEQYGQWVPIAELILFILGSAGMFFFSRTIKWKKATELFKDKLVPAILREEFDNVIYFPDEGVSCEQAEKMKVICCGERMHSEDYIEADYKGYHFALSECCAVEGNSNGYTAFFGKILDLDYNKEAVVDVYVCGKNFSYPPNPVQAAKKTVKMESVHFNECYTVYCGQREMAFYVLTPQVQEALLKLGERMNYDMAVNFSGKRLYVAITDKHNTLELPNSRYINYMEERTRIKQEMSFVKVVLETLPICHTTGMPRYLIEGYNDKDFVATLDMQLGNLQLHSKIIIITLAIVIAMLPFIAFLFI